MYTRIATPLFLCTAFLTGCATFVGDPRQTISVHTEPAEATITVTDIETNEQAFIGTTPVSFALKKSDGTYFGGRNYRLSVQKAGYKEYTVHITTSPNGWYIGGNFLVGGLIGWLIVDPFFGHMYTLSPEHISTQLQEQHTAADDMTDDTISIVLLEDVPEHLRAQMQPVH